MRVRACVRVQRGGGLPPGSTLHREPRDAPYHTHRSEPRHMDRRYRRWNIATLS